MPALRPVLPILIGVALMLSLTMGLRQSLGLFLTPLTRDLELAVADFTLAIANQAFLERRVRYQDGPDLCFLKLQRELAENVGTVPSSYLSVSDAEIEAYRTAHTPKPPQRRPKPPVQE